MSYYARKLFIGTAGVWLCYLLISYLTEKIFHLKYTSIKTDANGKHLKHNFVFPSLTTWAGCLFCSIYGTLYARFKDKTENKIPASERFTLGLLFTLNYLPTNYALLFISYPLQMIAKNIRYLFVVIIGVFFSRVSKNRELQLPKSKFLIAILITMAALMFMYFESSKEVKKMHLDPSKEWIGYILIFIAIVCDAMFSDSQAYCKANFKPSSNQLFLAANLYGFLLIFLFALISGELVPSLRFVIEHPRALLDVVSVGILQITGQVSIYYVISNFKQHIYPLISTSRRIITILLSIFIFQHSVTKWQWLAIIILFGSMAYELFDEIQSQEYHRHVRKQKELEKYIEKEEEKKKSKRGSEIKENKENEKGETAAQNIIEQEEEAEAMIGQPEQEERVNPFSNGNVRRSRENERQNNHIGKSENEAEKERDRLESLSKYRYGWRVEEVVQDRETSLTPNK